MTRAEEHSPHFFTDPSLIEDGRVTVEGPDARHLATVRRARAGDRIHVSDGAGRVLEVRIVTVTLGRVEGEVVGERRVEPSRPRVAVFQALAKGAKLDIVVQKLVEIGVDEVVVFTAGRSVPRWDGERAGQALARWSAVALEASKQSRRAWLPQVEGPVAAEQAAEGAARAGLSLMPEASATRRLREVLPVRAPEEVAVVIGPEGGLTPEEVGLFERHGALAVTLGPQILRTETAALVAVSLVLYHFRKLG